MNELKACLKSCPFCGKEAKASSNEVSGMGYTDGYDTYCVTCTKCGCGTGDYIDLSIAIEKWNRRVKRRAEDEATR